MCGIKPTAVIADSLLIAVLCRGVVGSAVAALPSLPAALLKRCRARGRCGSSSGDNLGWQISRAASLLFLCGSTGHAGAAG